MDATKVVNTTTAGITMKVGCKIDSGIDTMKVGSCGGVFIGLAGLKASARRLEVDPNWTYQEFLIGSAADRPRVIVCSDDECVNICRLIAVDLDGQCTRLENMGAQLDRLSTYMQQRSASKFQFSTMLIVVLFVLLFSAVITLRA